jgi:2,3-bisphosphoglycerate-independent phosphoglycerate mutase
MQLAHKPIILIVLDGWGYSEDPSGNAIHDAHKPVWDRLWNTCPHTLINASGREVGLPGTQMGNSEVGHMNIGSGRIIKQEFTRITDAIADGSFFNNDVLLSACHSAAAQGAAVHIMGLLSPGGVHSHQDHIFALMELASNCGLEHIYLHAFLDGRDTPPRSAVQYIRDFQDRITALGKGTFAGIIGRYYAMDRNNNWERTRLAYDLITLGKAEFQAADASSAIAAAYARGETDEFVKPTAVVRNGAAPVRVNDGDLVIFANFRADRARQLSMAFTEQDFTAFPRDSFPHLCAYIGMTEYKADFNFPAAFPPERHNNVLGELLAAHGLRQLRIAETEKYAHVTFFFNGGEELVSENEDRILVPSPDVPTYDMKPEMSAYQVTDKIVEAVVNHGYDVIICNFANADMVGHTGKYDAAVQAIETLDKCLGRIVEVTRREGGEIIITSDHGNAEQMVSRDNRDQGTQPHTAHTNNLVPLLFIGRSAQMQPGIGALCDIAPTMLYIMGLKQPPEMTGRVLLRFQEQVKQAV